MVVSVRSTYRASDRPDIVELTPVMTSPSHLEACRGRRRSAVDTATDEWKSAQSLSEYWMSFCSVWSVSLTLTRAEQARTDQRLVTAIAGLDDLSPHVFRPYDGLRRRTTRADVNLAVEIVFANDKT